MSDYIKPGSVTKTTYVTTQTVVENFERPSVDARIEENYTANIPQIVLGKERIRIESGPDGELGVSYSRKGDSSLKQAWNAMRIAGKILRKEFGKAFSDGKGMILYNGLPSNIDTQVDSIVGQYNAATKAFEEAMQLPIPTTVESNRQVLRVSPKGIEDIVA